MDTQSRWKQTAIVMTALIALFQLVNSVRAFANPVLFASYFGTPLSSPQDTSFVGVYAIRTAFIGLFVSVQLLRKQYDSLAMFARIAVILPVVDALLVATHGGSTARITVHAVVAVYVAITAWALHKTVSHTSAARTLVGAPATA